MPLSWVFTSLLEHVKQVFGWPALSTIDPTGQGPWALSMSKWIWLRVPALPDMNYLVMTTIK